MLGVATTHGGAGQLASVRQPSGGRWLRRALHASASLAVLRTGISVRSTRRVCPSSTIMTSQGQHTPREARRAARATSRRAQATAQRRQGRAASARSSTPAELASAPAAAAARDRRRPSRTARRLEEDKALAPLRPPVERDDAAAAAAAARRARRCPAAGVHVERGAGRASARSTSAGEARRRARRCWASRRGAPGPPGRRRSSWTSCRPWRSSRQRRSRYANAGGGRFDGHTNFIESKSLSRCGTRRWGVRGSIAASATRFRRVLQGGPARPEWRVELEVSLKIAPPLSRRRALASTLATCATHTHNLLGLVAKRASSRIVVILLRLGRRRRARVNAPACAASPSWAPAAPSAPSSGLNRA